MIIPTHPNLAALKTVVLIAGPTASGKTALALELAKRHEATIINADSAQVYDALPILSAQPTVDEMAHVMHKLFSYRSVMQPCSAADWATDAKAEITAAHAGGRLPILVGGTGLYLRTLLEGVAPIPDIPAEQRTRVREMPTTDAYSALTKEDVAMASILSPNDDSRIKRALEVIRATGRSIAAWRSDKVGGIADHVDLRPLILEPPRSWLHARCNMRFEKMLEQGAVDEVRQLLAMNLPFDAPVLRAIGVPEIAAMLANTITQSQAIERGQAATRQYAKRQYTWFRNQTPATWPRWNGEINFNNIDKIVTLFQI